MAEIEVVETDTNPMVKAGHLGGYLQGGDPDTIYPELWAWLVETWEVRSVVDIGCGDGCALRHFRELGCTVLGVEGVPQEDEDIWQHDYTSGPLAWTRAFDLAWSAEFVEHVEEAYLPNYMATFQHARYALITHAEPGAPGWHHVNCRSADYWKGVFAGAGFEFDESLTAMTRMLAACNTSVFNHYRRSGLAFRRRT